ncbi:MAG: heavy metal-binding domain-containing protein [Candidatus Gastranaerophilales bacterium]|nr:heavy metal-binding domain-containing protein [Candidatus Gastranaerophilales bacterium]
MQCHNCGKQNDKNATHCSSCNKKLNANPSEEFYCTHCGNPLLFANAPCPYCNSSLKKNPDLTCIKCGQNIQKNSMFSHSRKLNELDSVLLGFNTNYNGEYCTKCIKEERAKAKNILESYKNRFTSILAQMPVITLEKPTNFTVSKYCNIITAQAVADASEIKEFLKQNGKFNAELENNLHYAEKECLASLKKKAVLLGANAIIGCDIEYAQLSIEKPAFLVAFMGTAVVAEDFEILTETEQYIFNAINLKSLN